MRRVAAAALVPFAFVCFAACAESPPPPPTAAMPPPGVAAAPPPGGSPVDGEMLKIARAEEDIDRVLAHAAPPRARREEQKAPADDGRMAKGASKDETKAAEGEAERAGGVEGCAVACKALASMATSADQLCHLTGEDDGRCDDARARVRGASARVKSACPACTVSTAPAPALPPAPAKEAPAGPAPGMPGSTVPKP